jgi:hypothetical protein
MNLDKYAFFQLFDFMSRYDFEKNTKYRMHHNKN